MDGYFERFGWWGRLHPGIRRYIMERFERFTSIQEEGIPRILSGRHTLLIAPTGTGKTEAALFPVLSKILESHERGGVSALYVTPLRALNRDMMERVSGICRELGIRLGVRHGDTPPGERRSQAISPPDLLVTTPETAQILLYGKRMRDTLRALRWVIVDEVHELASSERGLQFSIVMERLSQIAEFQRVGLSATIGHPDAVLKYLTGAERDGEIVDVTSGERMEIVVDVPEPDRYDEKMGNLFGISARESAMIRRISNEVSSCSGGVLLFVNTRKTAENLAYMMKKMTDLPFMLHHGSLSREIRVHAEEEFKAGRVRMLICTSSLELGIDVGNIDLVIQYGSPRQTVRMIQRIGRSGHRIGRIPRGLVISPGLIDAIESDILAERVRNRRIEHISIRRNALAPLANQIIAESCAKGRFNKDEFFALVKNAYPYHGLDRKSYDALLEMLASIRVIRLEGGDVLASRRSREYFVSTVSMIPDESKVHVIDSITREEVGTLDEAFAQSLRPGETFILQGKAREVIAVEQDKMISKGVTESGMLPSWIGEEIPVTPGVARDVLLAISSGRAVHRGIPSPDGKEISESRWLMETRGRECVMILPLGTRGGTAMAHLVGMILSRESGEGAAVSPTPYGIVFTLPKNISADRFLELLRGVKDVRDTLLEGVTRTHLYRYRFIQSARKFGVLSPQADISGINIDGLIKSYRGTPLDTDVITKILTEDMDLPLIRMLIDLYLRGEVDIRIRPGFSKLAECLIEEVSLILYPERARNVIARIVRERIERRRVSLLCMNCLRVIMRRISDLPEEIRCPRCRGGMLALCDDCEQSEKLLKKRHLTDEEKKKIDRMRLSADLIRVFGKKGVIALSAHGIGEVTASRILNKRRQSDEEFYLDIVDAEVTYERTHRFWG